MAQLVRMTAEDSEREKLNRFQRLIYPPPTHDVRHRTPGPEQ
eukprot:gene18178-9008_t